MGHLEIGLIGFAALFLLLAIRMPVGTAMLVVGVVGIWVIHPRGDEASIATLGGEIFSVSTIYSLTILPLFILMGNLAGVLLEIAINANRYRPTEQGMRSCLT